LQNSLPNRGHLAVLLRICGLCKGLCRRPSHTWQPSTGRLSATVSCHCNLWLLGGRRRGNLREHCGAHHHNHHADPAVSLNLGCSSHGENNETMQRLSNDVVGIIAQARRLSIAMRTANAHAHRAPTCLCRHLTALLSCMLDVCRPFLRGGCWVQIQMAGYDGAIDCLVPAPRPDMAMCRYNNCLSTETYICDRSMRGDEWVCTAYSQ
jgi:hypothetical protein